MAIGPVISVASSLSPSHLGPQRQPSTTICSPTGYNQPAWVGRGKTIVWGVFLALVAESVFYLAAAFYVDGAGDDGPEERKGGEGEDEVKTVLIFYLEAQIYNLIISNPHAHEKKEEKRVIGIELESGHGEFPVVRPVRTLAQVLCALDAPALGRELVNDRLELVERAESRIAREVVLGPGRTAGDGHRAVVVADADVVLAHRFARLLGEGFERRPCGRGGRRLLGCGLAAKDG